MPQSTPSRVGWDQVLAEAAFWRSREPGLAFLGVQFEVRRLPMRLKRCLVPVYLVKVETVRVVPILNYIKA